MNPRSLIGGLAALVLPASAGTKTWDGAGGNANWSTAANWNADGLPAAADAVTIDNSTVNPVPQINAQSGANCGTLTVDGAVGATFLNYSGATPLVTNLYGASVNPANTGPLLNITANAPTSVGVNKVNFQLRTNGEFFVGAGRSLNFSNGSWTFATWFKRASRTTEDFILYIASRTLARDRSPLEFVYRRGHAALAAAVIFTVEWSDTLTAVPWSDSGITERILSDNGIVQTVVAAVPTSGMDRAFVRLRASMP